MGKIKKKPDKYDLSHKRDILHAQNWSNKFLDIHGPVTLAVLVLVSALLTYTIGWPVASIKLFTVALDWINRNLGWFYILTFDVILIALLYFAFSKYGEIRIGGEMARPEFKTLPWLAMLLCCGMGSGVLFFGVYEPMTHSVNPPPFWREVDNSSLKVHQNAMLTTFYHWGINPWALYALFAIALAFFAYNRKLPLSIRSVFYPILKDKIFRWPGHLIDIFAMVATLFGLVIGLGIGADMVAAGIHIVFPAIENTRGLNISIIAIVTLIATASVVTGLRRGIQFLSNVNIIMAGILLLIILIMGPSSFVFSSFIENIGLYLQQLLPLSFWNESYDSKFWSDGQSSWQSGWTLFYWGWWISWTPFVSTFIARISFGRTIREMAIGIMFAPSLACLFFMNTAGSVAMWEGLHGIVDVFSGPNPDSASSFYLMLQGLPQIAGLNMDSPTALMLVKFTSIITIFVSGIFFITSSDSGSMVVDLMAAGGKLHVPVAQKVFWAFLEGLIAIILLLGGAEDVPLFAVKSMQAGLIVTALPFAIIILLAISSLRKSFYNELHRLYGDDAPDRFFTTETHRDEVQYQGPEEEILPQD